MVLEYVPKPKLPKSQWFAKFDCDSRNECWLVEEFRWRRKRGYGVAILHGKRGFYVIAPWRIIKLAKRLGVVKLKRCTRRDGCELTTIVMRFRKEPQKLLEIAKEFGYPVAEMNVEDIEDVDVGFNELLVYIMW